LSSPETYFDVLSVTRDICRITDAAALNEILTFCYLACLLSMYEGQPASDWGYGFAATSYASPYSEEIARSVDELKTEGSLSVSGSGLALSESGIENLRQWRSLSRFKERSRYLRVACSSGVAIPLPLVSASIGAEPQLKRAAELKSTRALLTGPSVESLYSQFGALSHVVPQGSSSLLVPAVIWLNYLAGTEGMIPSHSEADELTQ
jgi:hypothetical protein